jgi:hypothetical protein
MTYKTVSHEKMYTILLYNQKDNHRHHKSEPLDCMQNETCFTHNLYSWMYSPNKVIFHALPVAKSNLLHFKNKNTWKSTIF